MSEKNDNCELIFYWSAKNIKSADIPYQKWNFFSDIVLYILEHCYRNFLTHLGNLVGLLKGLIFLLLVNQKIHSIDFQDTGKEPEL